MADPTADRHEIHELLARYSHVVDGGPAGGYDQLFTADGVYDLSAFNAPSLVTREAISGLLHNKRASSHLTTDIIIDFVSDDEAAVASKWLVFTDGAIRSGEYADVVTRTQAGWRFKVRKAIPRLGGDPAR